jgi:hypothetical protein
MRRHSLLATALAPFVPSPFASSSRCRHCRSCWQFCAPPASGATLVHGRSLAIPLADFPSINGHSDTVPDAIGRIAGDNDLVILTEGNHFRFSSAEKCRSRSELGQTLTHASSISLSRRSRLSHGLSQTSLQCWKSAGGGSATRASKSAPNPGFSRYGHGSAGTAVPTVARRPCRAAGQGFCSLSGVVSRPGRNDRRSWTGRFSSAILLRAVTAPLRARASAAFEEFFMGIACPLYVATAWRRSPRRVWSNAGSRGRSQRVPSPSSAATADDDPSARRATPFRRRDTKKVYSFFSVLETVDVVKNGSAKIRNDSIARFFVMNRWRKSGLSVVPPGGATSKRKPPRIRCR